MTYEYTCTNKKCLYEFDENRLLENRNDKISCPHCGENAERAYRTFRFHETFSGSVRHEMNTDAAVRMSVEAQDEGFTSAMEREEAHGQAVERAAMLGVPVSNILGSKPSGLVGENYTPEAHMVKAQADLTKKSIEAEIKGDLNSHKKHQRNLNELNAEIKQKSAKLQAKKEFKPENSKEDHKKMITRSRRARGGIET